MNLACNLRKHPSVRMRIDPSQLTTALPTPAYYSDSYVYDEYGRLAEKGGSTYTYSTTHPHAASQAHGWTYSYNGSGDVERQLRFARCLGVCPLGRQTPV